ncbi:hypothetical protein GCM10027449_15800 [Sinomonas notoginsengisoli]
MVPTRLGPLPGGLRPPSRPSRELRPPACLSDPGSGGVYGHGMAVAEELEGQTSIEDALAELGEPWAVRTATDGTEPPTLF